MKARFFSILLAIALMGSACAILTGSEKQQVITNILARRVGCEIGKKEQAKVDKYLEICNDILALDDEVQIKEIVLNAVIDILVNTEDPLIVKDIEDLLALFGVDTSIPGMPDIEDISIDQLKNVAKRFKYGIEVCS